MVHLVRVIRKVTDEEAKVIKKNAIRYQENWKKYLKSSIKSNEKNTFNIYYNEKTFRDCGSGFVVMQYRRKEKLMNVLIILSILVIVIGVLLLVATPSVLFKLNWKEKTGKEKILMFMFYSILVYIINIIYWIIKG